jgi:hypothetical protein
MTPDNLNLNPYLPAILVASTEFTPRQQQRIHTTGNKRRNRLKRIAKASRRRNRK